uniref:Uncharacterized protein n=1 Tax=Tanacetum cinerariifolium TaxID=118510 RepID=A0A699H3P0_TANCI|nr:hypothetical protein [Tanacetum cinerariifolium]
MASFDYHLTPLYPIKECSSCGALNTTDYRCSDGSLVDKIICNLNKTADLFQEPPQSYPKCENPVDGQYCQGCALLRKELKEVLSIAYETILEIEHTFEEKHCQQEDILELFRRLHNDVQNIHEELTVYINTPSWDRPTICYNDDDDEECTIAITPILSTEELDNSLSMGDEHLDTILETESDELIKSIVENLVPIPSEYEGILDNMCDVPFYDNSPPLDISKDQFEDFSDSNDDSTSIDDDSFSIDDIEYVEDSPPDSELVSLEVVEIVIPDVGGIDADILLTIKDDILSEKLLNINFLIAKIKALKDNPTLSSDFMTKSFFTSLNFLLEETNTFDNSLSESKTFCIDLEEISSDSTTTRSDIFLPDYEAFYDDHVKEISSGSTTTRSDIFLPDYEAFYDDHVKEISSGSTTTHSDFLFMIRSSLIFRSIHFLLPIGVIFMSSPMSSLTSYLHRSMIVFSLRSEPELGDFTIDVVEDIFQTREPRVHILPTHPTLQLNLDFILSSEFLFAYIVWIFLSFLSYSVAP